MILVYIYRREENFEQLSPLFITLIFDIFVNATDGFSFTHLYSCSPSHIFIVSKNSEMSKIQNLWEKVIFWA